MRALAIIGLFVTEMLILSGCAGGPPVSEQSNEDLCRKATLGSLLGHDAARRKEMISRGLIDAAEWPQIKSQIVSVGMSECGALGATYRFGGPYFATTSPYRMGGKNWLVLPEFDPRTPPASYTNWMNERSASPYSTPQPTQQLYVPKYLIGVEGGRVIACYGVDLNQFGPGMAYDIAFQDSFFQLVKMKGYPALFSHPCNGQIPGFDG